MGTPPEPLVKALRRMGLCDSGGAIEGCMLAGGVSSDIWRIDLPGRGPVCVKRALAKLKVTADWRAPLERNRFEAMWLRWAGRIWPGAAPDVLGQDDETGALAMSYLAPERHPTWKACLQKGQADTRFAAEVGRRLASFHAASAADPALAADFPTDEIFRSIRLEPYLLATALRHPDCAGALHSLADAVWTNRRALVHGDVSPKNILVGPDGPVFLDAECAWWGDPAFDIAFCLNHLLLKCLWTPSARSAFLACFSTLASVYLDGVTWEARGGLDERAARLLPGLLLARVDGKSPVEYITADSDRERVRRVGRRLLLHPPGRIVEVRRAWVEELET